MIFTNATMPTCLLALIAFFPVLTSAQSIPGTEGATDPSEPVVVADDNEGVSSIPRVRMSGMGHLQYAFDKQGEATSNRFVVGGLVLFLTSDITDDLRFFNETVFEFTESGEAVLDVERVLLQYTVSDALVIEAGRGHTALGFWNSKYHHGVWLQRTIDRPSMYRFEDEGGILPAHYIGLQVGGDLPVGPIGVEYHFTVANGRGDNVDSLQIVEDLNDQKALYFNLTLHPEFAPGLGIGGGVGVDKIVGRTTTDSTGMIIGGHSPISERLFNAHLYYIEGPIFFASEATIVDHRNSMGQMAKILGGYAVASATFGVWSPYYRFDFIEITDGETGHFFSGLEDEQRHTGGVRWDVVTFAAANLEYRLIKRLETRHEVIAQMSFVY